MLSTLGRLDEAAGDRKGVPNWLSTHPGAARAREEIEPTVERAQGGPHRISCTNRDGVAARRRRRHLRRQPRAGHHARQHRSSIRRCDSGSTFRTSGRSPTARSRSSRRRRTPTSSCCSQVVTEAAGTDGRDVGVAPRCRRGIPRGVSGDRTTINGLDAFVGVYQGQIEGLGEVRAARHTSRTAATSTWLPASSRLPASSSVDGTFYDRDPIVSTV